MHHKDRLTRVSALWILTTSFIYLNWRKYRSVSTVNFSQNTNLTYATNAISPILHRGIPFQDISQIHHPEVFHIPAPPNPWDRPITPPGCRQPIIPDSSTSRTSEGDRSITQDPLSGLTFAWSDKSSPDEGPMDLKRFIRRQPKSIVTVPKRAAVAPSVPPPDTEQRDWSARSSLNVSARDSASISQGRVRSLTMDELPLVH
jgi:hypothetical protein